MEFADGYEGVTHAGVLYVDPDSGRMLLAQRAYDGTDDPDVQETWEVPGGSLEEGEDPYAGALREFSEEVGYEDRFIPQGEVVHGWRRDNYQGFVVAVDEATAFDTWAPTYEVQDVGWFTTEEARTLALRPEFAATDIEALVAHAVSGNEDDMDDDESTEIEQVDEPEFDSAAFAVEPIPIHGVLAPEETPTGDQRGFNAGSITRRPLRLPFSWQKSAISGHDGSVVTGSVDRLMRKDGKIHFEGLLMPSADTDDLLDLITFFTQFGVSVDGDKGNLDASRSEDEQMMWFDSVRASGLTAVAIPAFHEAFVALGPHPEMPADDTEEALTASGLGLVDMVGGRSEEFKRGKGWVTNPKETRRLHAYWTQKGQPGYAKIGWGTPGDWRRAKALIGEKIAKNSPDKMRFLNQIISQWHFDALGYWPGELGKPGNAPDTPENRRRAARHAASGETVTASEESATEEAASGERHIEVAGIEETEEGWEVVLTSSAGTRAIPPLSYFHRHPDTGPLTVEEPDEFSIRRVHGYAAQWGVCHVGFDGQCVEPPVAGSDDYPEFHLGRTRTADGYVPTGVLTYGIGHRDSDTILSESPEQAYFDNVNNAWAAVRVGEDEFGIWFSGVVLPGIPEDHLVKIEASGQVSGEWLRGAMRACLTVNVPGFPVEQPSVTYDTEGNVLALAASAFGSYPCGESPAERMEALRRVDAEARFENLRKKWSA